MLFYNLPLPSPFPSLGLSPCHLIPFYISQPLSLITCSLAPRCSAYLTYEGPPPPQVVQYLPLIPQVSSSPVQVGPNEVS
jgi:hypothetical protein